MRTKLAMALVPIAIVMAACGDDKGSPIEAQERASEELTRQEQKKFEQLTIRQIMQGPGIVGTSPSDPRFSANGLTVYFEWNDPHSLDSLNTAAPENAYEHYLDLENRAGTYSLDVASGRVEKLSEAEADTVAPAAFAWDRSRQRRVEVRDGDIFLVNASDGRTRRITATLARESGAQISPDGESAYFVRDDNLFQARWTGGPARQITNLALADDPEATELSEQRQYLLDQQKALFDEFKERGPADDDEDQPQKLYLGEGYEIANMNVSPSGAYVAIELSKEASGTRQPLVPEVITESGYIETGKTRPKVGEAQDDTRVVLFDVRGDSLIWADTDETWWVSIMSWSPTEDVLLIRAITADWHDRYFLTVRPERLGENGKLNPHEMDAYHDDAWVGGPGFYETGAWVPDGTGIYFISEADGWARLYTVSNTGRKTQLTDGPWEVQEVFLDVERGRWYLISNEGRWGSARLWQMNLDGSDRRLLTSLTGGYQLVFSPDMRRAAVLYSTLTSPNELYVYNAEDERLDGPYTKSTTSIFRGYRWIVPAELTFKASDGQRVRAHIFRPEEFGAESNGAGIVFIHGAGYLQNVVDSWGYYYREFMFNNFLASRGYTVLNVDFRGSAGYGRECRTAIYKHMGGRDLGDIVDGAKYLMREHGVGKDQVGVYGGSYGGFLTLMALFKNPKEITAGAALRSVTDWAHYNHWYTSRILGTPAEDSEAYERSSPIYFADGFEGHLVMLHGLKDSNVLAQDILRLSQRLIELGKENWELALHPVEGHAYRRASSWTDQMTRAFKLFEETLPNDAPKRKR